MKPGASLPDQKLAAAWRMLTRQSDGMFLDYAKMFLEIAAEADSAPAKDALPHVLAAIRNARAVELRDAHTAKAIEVLRPHALALGLD